jgi:predicted RNA binding protein YcfA (HicA-like mRNA interferase family)
MSRMPQLTARDLILFLKSHGFVEERQSGSHLTMRDEGRSVTLTIPVHTGCASAEVSPYAFSRMLGLL